ncbi:MAG: dockerin type I repeat-containing protein, partial [bacterium]|nr:dockerin type I repeat-containing protein [bacterium]MDW8164300.1 dockerin type I repeat-containing protein [Candidatus Omnitrophota bacterium]
FFGDTGSFKIYQDSTENVFDGLTSIKVEFISKGTNWAGLYWRNPENNWGNIPNSGYNLTGAKEISFYAKGKKGGEKVEFFVGGINGPYPDSLSKVSTGIITLTSNWEKYKIPLISKDLSYVIGGFGVSINGAYNPDGATFYIDKIQYNLSRNNELRFLRSYKTIKIEEPDKYLHNTCFIYDNSLSLMAFIIKGEKERAKIIADSFIYAMNNDRFYRDNRLRNAYMSGDLIDIKTDYARIPGWWDSELGMWKEDEYQVSTYPGNIAWVIISLCHFYLKYGGEEYKESAIKLGDWIYLNTYDTRGNGGYTGGYKGWEPRPQKINWKSTEHNIDIYSAFKLLLKITGDTKWEERANHAKNFVLSMFNNEKNYFYSGTKEDGITPEQQPISLDVQAWAILSGITNFSQEKLSYIEENFLTTNNGFEGFDFNTDKDGVWFEGTSFMSLLYSFLGFNDKAKKYLEEVKKAQISGPNSDGSGIISSSKESLSTGLEWQYYPRLHTGTTSWFIFAKNLFNPFTGERKRDINKDYEVDITDVILCLRMAIGLNQPDMNLADINKDGFVDITDVILVLRKAISLD